MCGIFGIIGKDNAINYKKVVKSLFILSESRGKEAAGGAMELDDKILVFKSPLQASKMIKTKGFNNFLNNLSNNNSIFIGHTRLVTNGYEHFEYNNQPFIKNEIVGIHNGIIVNIDNLWEKYKDNNIKTSDLDSEIIPVIINSYLQRNFTLVEAVKNFSTEIEGVANIALLFNKYHNLLLFTNNGSLYYLLGDNIFIFASEYFILKKICNEFNLIQENQNLHQLPSNNFLILNTKNLNGEIFNTKEKKLSANIHQRNNIIITEIFKNTEKYNVYINSSLEHKTVDVPDEFVKHYHNCKEKIENLKRCTKCLLPETFPFIHFDEDGICNYCNNYTKQKVKGINELEKIIQKIRSKKGPNCIVAFSGGRDSSYTLHFIKKELGLTPLAYSYDWGMITDLARRNQSRMCSKLGVEHILISADIRKKREYIRSNVLAWLRKPHLGTVPLFMAGDKQYFYYAEKLKKQYGIELLFMGENLFEKTGFKIEFSGARQEQTGFMSYHMSLLNKFRMLIFYGKEYITNPLYINKSLFDTFGAFTSYYLSKHQYINLYEYIYWNEDLINKTLINEYNWELEPTYNSTWRIGDGTAPFYNYIYYIVAGFSENDTLRSNQIREGVIDRESALKKSILENQPRWKDIQWYCNTIGIDFEKTIRIINNIKKLY